MLSTKLMKQQVISLFLSPKGRISRGLFWKANLLLWLGFIDFIACVIIFKEIFKFYDDFQNNGFFFAFLLYFYAAFALTIKRLHDINWSGWLTVPCMLTGIFWLIVGIITGTSGKNKHGENPVEYELNRLYVNRGSGLPPPPPPLENPISKIILYTMIILPIPSLVVAGMVMPDKIEKVAVKQEESIVDKALNNNESQFFAEIMNIYNNPKLAPKVAECKSDVYCNAFMALSKKWKGIPDSYRYKGDFDIKEYAKNGITYDNQGKNIGLKQGFYFYTERTNQIIDGIDKYIETESKIPDNYEGGLAVLLYIEDKNGWTEESSNKEAIPFDLKNGDQYQKVEAKDGVDAYYVVTRLDGTIEHYTLDGILQWSNVEHEEELLSEDDMKFIQSDHNTQQKSPSTALSYLPFVGERYFNFMGGNGTEYIIKINPDGQTKIKLCGTASCIPVFNGNYTNPIISDDGNGFLFKNGKIYALPETGKLAEEGCQNYENNKCVSDLHSQ